MIGVHETLVVLAVLVPTVGVQRRALKPRRARKTSS